MSARSRERWRRYGILGMIRFAQETVRTIRDASHLSNETRAEADRLFKEFDRLSHRVKVETTEPTELSAKKGT